MTSGASSPTLAAKPRIALWYPAAPLSFDIVTCWYPETDTDPGPALRPGLVIGVAPSKTHNDRFKLRVCYGTCTLKSDSRAHLDLIIDDEAEYKSYGLTDPTRFDSQNTADLNYVDALFGLWHGKTSPVIGHLSDARIKEFKNKIRAQRGLPPLP